MVSLNNFCVYFHINPLKNEVFYVGMGDKSRPRAKRGRNPLWVNTVNKYGYIIDIVDSGLQKATAIGKEISYIKKIGRKDLGTGTLVNLTNGGDGLNGCSDDTRRKMSENAKGNKNRVGLPNKWGKHTIEAKLKMKLASTGNKYGLGYIHSEEAKQKISEKMLGNKRWLGKKHNEETKAKLRAFHLGRKHTPETIAKLSEQRKGRKLSAEHIRKSTQCNIGKKRTPEQRMRMKLAQSHRLPVSKETKNKMRIARIAFLNKNKYKWPLA